MKLVAYELGRMVQLVNPDEVRPVKGLYLPETVRLIGERYGFGVIPSVPQSIQGGAATFRQGKLVSGDKSIVIVEMTMHNDALAVNTASTTDDAEFVVQDVFAWAKQALGFRDPKTIRSKIYESHFVVDFDHDVSEAFATFARVTTGLQAAFKETYNYSQPFAFNRISFTPDMTAAPLPLVRSDLWIERRVGVPNSQNRYFSACGLPNEKHLRLLEDFERASKAKK